MTFEQIMKMTVKKNWTIIEEFEYEACDLVDQYNLVMMYLEDSDEDD